MSIKVYAVMHLKSWKLNAGIVTRNIRQIITKGQLTYTSAKSLYQQSVCRQKNQT